MNNPRTEYIAGRLRIYFNMMSDGGAMVQWDGILQSWKLYEIPLYGGEPRHVATDADLTTLVRTAEGWT